MPTIVHTRLTDLDGMKFTGETASGFSVDMDAMPAVGGKNEGPRPAELPFVGLSGCTGMDTISILRKMRQNPTRFEVSVEGLDKAEEHPKVWREIKVVFHVDGDVEPAKLEKAIDLSRTRYCTVSLSLKNPMKIHYAYVLNGKTVEMEDK